MSNESPDTARNESPAPGAPRLAPATWLALAALVVAVLAAGAAGYAWYQSAVTARLESVDQRNLVQRVAGEFDEIKQAQGQFEQRFDALGERLAALQSQTDAALAAASRERTEAIEALRGEVDLLSTSVEQVYTDLGRSVDTWMLEEAEQLLLLANQRLALVHDAALASTALRLADAKLAEIGDPRLTPVRERIAEELAVLGAMPRLDVSGAALRLAALMEEVPGMALAQDLQRPEWQSGEAPPDAEADGSAGTMERFAREVLDDLGNLVRVRRVDEARLPKLTPVQRFLVHENLRLQLSGAQYALLRGDGELFRANLDAARQWAGRYLDVGAEPVRSLLDAIDEMSALPVDRETPSIAGSLEALRAVMLERASK